MSKYVVISLSKNINKAFFKIFHFSKREKNQDALQKQEKVLVRESITI